MACLTAALGAWAQEAETVEAQEARVVAAYEDALRLMQSGDAAEAQVLFQHTWPGDHGSSAPATCNTTCGPCH
jgi:TolA-binding protein